MKRSSLLPFRTSVPARSFAVLLTLGAFWGSPHPVQAQSSNVTSGKVLKWDQPPALAAPTNVFYGWNQQSVIGVQVAADDWVCTTTNPVTKIRWWGSFVGWTASDPTPVLPPDFKLHFWTDQPKGGAANPFSHPQQAIWQITCTNYTWQCVGKDYDPRTGQFETCFLFEQTLNPQEWFFQNPLTGTNIYWLSIAAEYPVGVPTNYPFGWKTRPRSPASSAPDAAVVVLNPNNPIPGSVFGNGFPITWPGPTNEWDLAFELVTTTTTVTNGGFKWEQLPNLSTNGIDVNATFDPANNSGDPPYLLAGDFLCTLPGLITNITIWGSWLNDLLPRNDLGQPDPSFVEFRLSIHADLPATNGNFSRPGAVLWTNVFQPGQFTYSVMASNIVEGWLTPPGAYLFPGDHVCYQYDFTLPSFNKEPFFQQGTSQNPVVYWLDVQARIILPSQSPPFPRFGWKTSVTNWNDDATWALWVEPPVPPTNAWNELFYPPNILQGKSADLAFRLNGGASTNTTETVKWSQRPVVGTNAGNWYNGWNEPSIDGGGVWINTPITNIVADDWLCTNARPVTDIHWWGSFLNWTGTNLPPQAPVAYHFGIWTDVPTNAAGNPFSHPGTVLWDYVASTTDPNLRINWVGWDLDPRTTCLDVETCFKFNYYLPRPNWFTQPNGTNIFWLSISAIYPGGPGGPVGPNPFGWKTRPHVPVPPDDAVRIFVPLRPAPGTNFVFGQPIEFPQGTSWDMAFQLSSCQQSLATNVVITNIAVTNVGPNQLITIKWNAQPGVVYQLQETPAVYPPPSVWTDIGPPVIGPADTVTVTNTASLQARFYRILVPDICPP